MQISIHLEPKMSSFLIGCKGLHHMTMSYMSLISEHSVGCVFGHIPVLFITVEPLYCGHLGDLRLVKCPV